MKEPKATQVPCTCENGCYLYEEPVEVICQVNRTPLIIEGYFIKKDGTICYIGRYIDGFGDDNQYFDGIGAYAVNFQEE